MMGKFFDHLDRLEAGMLDAVEAKAEMDKRIQEELSKRPLGLTKEQFKKAFVPQFLASMCADRYAPYCAAGRQEEITNLPFEDAEFCAEEIYDKYYKYKNP